MSKTAAELNAIEAAKRDAHLAASMKPVKTHWLGRNTNNGDKGHDARGHKSSGGVSSNF